jgi:hypothetical protein
MKEPGRFCPLDYRYAPASFARAPDFAAETLYVVGGLYGNVRALDAIEELASAEAGPIDVVFNGDFHWFDATSERFNEVSRRVSAHWLLRGNVETELARANDVGAGCGCAYPDPVDEGTVERSNRIHVRLRECVDALPGARDQLGALPMTLVAAVGHLRVGIVHGDAESLAGWRFAHDALDMQTSHAWLEAVRATSGIDVFASSHTCLPALRNFDLDAGKLTIANNGAAGMPNFRGTNFGVVTRIGLQPSPHRPLYGVERDGVFIDALPVHYHQQRWLQEFVANWPRDSPAHVSYFNRLIDGPAFSVNEATASHASSGAQQHACTP